MGKMTLFYLFFNKNSYPYVNERPASTASFSGGIGDRTTTTTKEAENDYMIIDFRAYTVYAFL